MSGPLSGITVLEMAGIGPGPFCAMLLADLGADVICIERKPDTGDAALERFKGPTSVVDRGRRSLAVDLKDPQAIDLVRRLVDGADALIEGYRPGVMERLGLGPEVCQARNPKLVYGRMTGWGQTGPLSRVAGHDINYIALAGALHAIGAADRPPTVPLNLIGDYGGGGLLLAFGLVSALFEAQRSGRGQVVDAAMCDGAATLMTLFYGLSAGGQWQSRRESNFLDGAAPFYCCYLCADGKYLAVGAIEPKFYQMLLNKLELDDPRLHEQWRQASWPEQRDLLAEVFQRKSRDEWCRLLEESDVCVSPVLDLDEAPRHPHHRARDTFTSIDKVVQPAPAPRFSRTPGRIRHGVMPPGRHSREVLAELGLKADEIGDLAQRGVIHVHE